MEDIKKTLEIKETLHWPQNSVRQRSFDTLLLAQAARRGPKLFTLDKGILHDKVFGKATSTGRRVKIHEGRHIIYISISP